MYMRVLVVKVNQFRREGITNVVMNLYDAVDKSDMHIDMVAVAPPGSEYVAKLKENGGEIFVVERSMRHPLRYIAKLSKVIRDGLYDVVHAHGNSGTLALEMVAAKKAGCKIRIAHSHSTSCKYKLAHRLLKGVFHAACTHRLACGEAAGKWLYDEKPFQIINNGVDTGRFAFSAENRSKIRQQYGLDDSRIVLGHVGGFTEGKNQRFLVDILRELTDRDLPYSLLLVGDGALRTQVQNKVREMGLDDKVLFVGETDRVSDYLSACDILAMPSLFEGLPLSLIEAQASGLHCVISANITREVDKTGNLTFLPLETGAAHWAEKIAGLQLQKDRNSVSVQAIEKIKACGYDIYTEADKLKEYYLRAVEEGR